MLSDYAMALPSVSHAWVFHVLNLIMIPSGLFDGIWNLYKNTKGYMNTHEGLTSIFIILSGVLQGCPLSGSLFVTAIDPLLHMFKVKLEDSALGWTRACADDIGIVLKHLADLPVVKIVIEKFTRVSGFKLKPAKCVIVLLSILANDSNTKMVVGWLGVNCPGWESMEVFNKAKHLGIFLGPFAGSCQLSKAIEKLPNRVNAINSLHLRSALTRIRLASRALTVLACIAQVTPPPINSRRDHD